MKLNTENETRVADKEQNSQIRAGKREEAESTQIWFFESVSELEHHDLRNSKCFI